MFAHEAYQIGIIQVVVLEERDGGLGRFLVLCLMNHFHDFSTSLYLYVFTDYYVWTQVQCQPDDETQPYLADDLELAMKTFLVFLECLDVVIEESKGA